MATQKSVFDIADEIFYPVCFIDHEGISRSFRRFSLNGKEGITDIHAEDIILENQFSRVEISTYYEAFIANNFSTLTKEQTSKVFPHYTTKSQTVLMRLAKFLSRFQSNDAPDKKNELWCAFSLEGEPLFEGQCFFYDDIQQKLLERAQEWENWAPHLPYINWRYSQ